jgi:hypothetical protein
MAAHQPPRRSVGDAYDHALAETIIGLFKTEVMRRRGLDDVEYATLEWVAWFNTQRRMAPLGYVPPAEFEDQYYRAPGGPNRALGNQLTTPPPNPGRFTPQVSASPSRGNRATARTNADSLNARLTGACHLFLDVAARQGDSQRATSVSSCAARRCDWKCGSLGLHLPHH